MATWTTAPQRTVLVVAILASFTAFLDGSAVNVALPAISDELGGGLASQQWIVDAYLLSLGAFILLAGSLSDVFGRKRVLMTGLVGFGLTSVACAVAPTVETLILVRGLKGVFGALLVPSSLALILDAFSTEKQGRAIGLWTAFTSIASIAGPALGGVLVDSLSWRWVFGINVLPIALGVVLAHRLENDPPRSSAAHVDIVGALLGVAGLGLPVFVLIELPRFGWGSPLIVGASVVGLISAVSFVAWELRTPQPMLPMAIFRARNFSVGNVATFFIYAGLSLGTFALAVFLQQSAGYSATMTGLAMVPSSLVLIGLSAYIGRLSGRVGPRLLMGVGPVIAGGGFALMLAITDEADYLTQVLPAVIVFGLGMAVTVAPLTATILGAVEPSHAGIASATNNAVSRVAGLIAIALAATLGGSVSIDLDSFHRLVASSAIAMLIGGAISAVGIWDSTNRVAPALGRATAPVRSGPRTRGSGR
ncbi:DHA2 family efflux MFS transporter permease subunit [Agromyces sp. CCNWLW203]|uniref:DHA2 family efflux MFS transporter permease subunit n=1 Tax=Agromyces sp. CCNWLW203 TaxID=3112842 RepID=UPI002F966C20